MSFRKIFINPSDIGGRYSALSYFGMVPALLAGLPVSGLLTGAYQAYHGIRNEEAIDKNDVFRIGAALGSLAQEGKNHAVFVFAKQIEAFGAWVEQLIAESTGKEGKGILPVLGDVKMPLEFYGKKACFIFMKMRGIRDPRIEARIKECEKKEIPHVCIEWSGPETLGAEFYRWEIITSIASAAMEINPFDEPNVKESKDLTGKVLEQFKKTGKIEMPQGAMDTEEMKIKIREADFLALLAYLPRNASNAAMLGALASQLQKLYHKPVQIGFGPRYLHSIGQLYKGGGRTGFFVEVVADDPRDAKVPGCHFSFGQLKLSQAIGDYEALRSKKLPVIWIRGANNPGRALQRFLSAVSSL